MKEIESNSNDIDKLQKQIDELNYEMKQLKGCYVNTVCTQNDNTTWILSFLGYLAAQSSISILYLVAPMQIHKQ